MVNRRTVLLGVGTAISVAGCTGETDSESTSTVTRTKTPTERPTDTATESLTEKPTPTEESTPSEEPTATEEPQYSIEVDVINQDREPVSGANVSITRGDQTVLSEETDESGSVLINDVESGKYHIHVSHSDYHGVNLDITVDDTSRKPTISLTPIDESPFDPEIIHEKNVRVLVVDEARGNEFAGEVADGIFQAVGMDVTNIGEESVDIWHDLFKLGNKNNSDTRYEPDVGLSAYLENGISGLYESINPGITTRIDIIFDIPEDVEPILVVGKESEHKIDLSRYNMK